MPSEQPSRLVRTLLEEADDAAREGDWQTVRARTEYALQLDPDNYTAGALLEAAERETASLRMEDVPAEGPVSDAPSIQRRPGLSQRGPVAGPAYELGRVLGRLGDGDTSAINNLVISPRNTLSALNRDQRLLTAYLVIFAGVLVLIATMQVFGGGTESASTTVAPAADTRMPVATVADSASNESVADGPADARCSAEGRNYVEALQKSALGVRESLGLLGDAIDRNHIADITIMFGVLDVFFADLQSETAPQGFDDMRATAATLAREGMRMTAAGRSPQFDPSTARYAENTVVALNQLQRQLDAFAAEC